MDMTSLRHRIALVTLLSLMAIPVFAQGRNEIGVIGLVTSYRKVNVTGPERSGKVGPTWGPAVGFVIGQSMGDHWGGELRYVYFQNDIELQSGGESTEFSAQSHAIHYDVLYYLTDHERTVRPFVAAGIGLKHYRGTGEEQSFQPLSDLALSDMFTVYFKVRSFRQNPVTRVWDATNPEYIVDDSRYVMLVDRSEVNTPSDTPRILYLEKLPK